MNKKIIGVIGVLVVLIYGLNAIGSANGSLRQISKPVVAVLLPITGDAAVYGESARNAALLASSTLAKLSKSQSGKVEIIIEDTSLKGSQTISVLDKIRGKIAGENKKLGAVVSFSSGETLAICSNTEKTKTLLLSSGSSPAITDCGPMTYSNFPSDVYQAEVLANRLGNINNKLAVLYIQNDYGQGAVNEFKKRVLEKESDTSDRKTRNNYQNRDIVYIGHAPGVSDFRTTLTKIKEENIKDLLIISYPREASILLKQADQLNSNFYSIYTSESLKDESFIKEIPSKYKSVFLTLSPVSYSGIESNDFKAEYRTLYKQDPAAYADYVYDNIILATEVSEMCNLGNEDTDIEKSECIKNYLRKYNGIGTTGVLYFGEAQSAQNKDYRFYRIEGSKFVAE